MAVENTTDVAGLNALWPQDGDPRKEGPAHIRLLKRILKLIANAGSLPALTNNAGKALITDGTNLLWGAPANATNAAQLGGKVANLYMQTDRAETRTNVGTVLRQSITPGIANANGTTHQANALQVTNAGNNSASAVMAFIREGVHGAYFGLDAGDNKFKVGGWSMGAVAYEILHKGNTTVDANGFIKQA